MDTRNIKKLKPGRAVKVNCPACGKAIVVWVGEGPDGIVTMPCSICKVEFDVERVS